MFAQLKTPEKPKKAECGISSIFLKFSRWVPVIALLKLVGFPTYCPHLPFSLFTA